MAELTAEIYSYKILIDLTEYISGINIDFEDTDIINTFCSIVGYPSQSFESIFFNKADNRLWVEVYYNHQVKSIFKELEKLNTELFKHELNTQIEELNIPAF